jgi:hypothetical protein
VAVAGTGNWPDPVSTETKGKKANSTETSYTTYTGNWPDPV